MLDQAWIIRPEVRGGVLVLMNRLGEPEFNTLRKLKIALGSDLVLVGDLVLVKNEHFGG